MTGIGASPERPQPEGRFVIDDGIEWYRIDDYDQLDPFLVTIPSSDDQWLFVSTSGALTAGRGSADRSLFPYETDDRLHRSGGLTGPVTLIRVAGRPRVWEPFAPWNPVGPGCRSLAKSATGDRLRFEEHDPETGLTFRSTWTTAGALGLVRRCELTLDPGRAAVAVDVLDGLLDVLPAQVELALQQTSSTLVDAYRRSELDPDADPDRPLAVFSLEALLSDRADPAEALRANAVWSCGLRRPTVTLSDRAVGAFRAGRPVEIAELVTGRKGAYLLGTGTSLEPGVPLRWSIGADVALDHPGLDALRRRVADADDLPSSIDAATDEASARLVAIVAAADGLQETADRNVTVHHFANTLFNVMRGGALVEDHRVDPVDVARFVAARNRLAAERFAPVAAALGRPQGTVELSELRAAVLGDPDLVRLVDEYLPVVFSRRHGDPSRPWNRFAIPPPGPDGGPARGYEGNWRDIFQNWEALVHSFPGYAESVVAKFLNASTLDGHNPYRITDRGIDWEEPEDGSWGNFGYWGDHQVVYLHRLLMALERFDPGRLVERLDDRVFSSADVPYRFAPYDDLVADPKQTLTFDGARQAAVDERVGRLGADGRLVPAPIVAGTSGVHHSTLAEKLVIPALAKLSNLVAGAGIWLNTQRPEWNDANNALVGNGVSTVTLFHLRDYLTFVDGLLAGATGPVRISRGVQRWLDDIEAACVANDPDIPIGPEGDRARRALLDQLGRAFETYRETLAGEGPGPDSPVEPSRLRRFIEAVGPHLDHAASASHRPDGLVHSYWLVRLEPGVARLEPLYEMLEGQAAALGATGTDPAAALGIVDALFDSELYRADQRSFVLYPDRRPPPFVAKNRIPDELVSEAILALRDHGTGLVVGGTGDHGPLRFGAELESGRVLAARLDRLVDPEPGGGDPVDEALAGIVRAHRAEIEAAYEAVFRHRAFTGRSQTMYRYEGLGSVYWHMVSKLLAGLQERTLVAAASRPGTDGLVAALADRYRRVRRGLGAAKTVAEQGSFPTDPHSHTPAHTGAQQPGMTGQVKEGILIRLAELGVVVDRGRARFEPRLLDRREFLDEARPWAPLGPGGRLEAGTLGFTWCGVPVVYHLATGEDVATTSVSWADGRVEATSGPELDRATSRALFAREGRVVRVDVTVPASGLLFP